jgi:hypothetical protein
MAFNGDYISAAEPLGNAFRPLRDPRADFSKLLSIGTDSAMTLVDARNVQHVTWLLTR